MAGDTRYFHFRISKRALFSAMTLALIAVALELFQRAWDFSRSLKKEPKDLYSVRLETSLGVPLSSKEATSALVHHPYLVYKHKANVHVPGLTINARGFRGTEWVTEKPPGTLRVAVLGGSVAFGYLVTSDEKVFTSLLESRLRSSWADRRVEVLNAGVRGYDSNQELILLATEVLQLQPDLVVLFDGFNDFCQSGSAPPQEVPVCYTFCQVEDALAHSRDIGMNLLRRSAFFDAMERAGEHRGLVRKLEDQKKPPGVLYFENDLGVVQYRHNLECMCRLDKAYGARTLIVSQPETFARKNPPQGEQRIRRKEPPGYGDFATKRYPLFVRAAREAAAQEGAGYLDLSHAFDDTSEEIFVDECHPNDRGNEILAEKLDPVVEAMARP